MKSYHFNWLSQTLVLVIGLLMSLARAHAQAPAWQSVTGSLLAVGGRADVYASAADAQGNVYIGGYFEGTITFCATTLVSAGSLDGFVAKWSPLSSSFVWAQRLGGAGADGVAGLTVSGGSVYAVGSFAQTASFGAITLTVSPVSSSGDGFVTKLPDTGIGFTWAQRTGDSARAVAVSGTSVYVVGSFQKATATFGAFTLTNSFAGFSDIYVTKLVDAGASAGFVWARSAGGAFIDFANSVAVNGTSIYVAGSFGGSGPVNNPAAFGSTTLASRGSDDAFVARLTDAGTSASFDWAVGAGATNYQSIYSLAVSGANVYVAGTFGNSTMQLGALSIANAGDGNGFVAKLDDAGTGGNFMWAYALGGAFVDDASGVVVSGNSVYVTGSYASDPATFGGAALASQGANDVYVAKLIDGGNQAAFAWTQRAGGTGNDFGRGVALAGNRIAVTGNTQAQSSFGSFTLPGTGTVSFPYVAALTDPLLTATAAPLRPEGLALFPNPARGRATVQLPPGTGPATLTVLDALGRPVRTQTVASSQAELDLDGLAPGLYAVRVQASPFVANRQLVIE